MNIWTGVVMVREHVAQEKLCALRRDIARIEGRLAETLEGAAGSDEVVLRRNGRAAESFAPSGSPRFDTLLGGGVPTAGLTEIQGDALRDAGLVAGFGLALARLAGRARADGPVLWIGTTELFRETGRPYPPGLAEGFGLDPHRLLLAEVNRLQEALWIAEEAASLGRFRAILLEVKGISRMLDLVATRRLHRRALAGGQPLLLLGQARSPDPTAAPVRLRIGPAPAGLRLLLDGALEGSIGRQAFRVTIDKSPPAIPATLLMEWTHDCLCERDAVPAAHPGSVVPLPVQRAPAAPALRPQLALPPAGRRTGTGH